ncbi:class I SAM-dependent methyltransferase [Tessaracoccus sp. G1721]
MSSESAREQSGQQVRARIHHMWGTVAASWDRHSDQVEQRAAVVSRIMVEAVAPAPGDDVLELACGAGGLGLAIAELVAPGGSVVLSDVAPAMVEIAAARAGALPRGGDAPVPVRARVIDLEQLALPDASFDVVVCREGLMFALDPARAVSEIARVLRPTGRVAIAVWGSRDRNPWLGVLADAVQEHTGTPVPPPGVPGPFSLGREGALAGLLAGAGFEEIGVDAVESPTHDDSFEDYWQLRTALAGPLKSRLDALPPDRLAAVKETVREGVSRYRHVDGLTIPGLAYVASARRPAGVSR